MSLIKQRPNKSFVIDFGGPFGIVENDTTDYDAPQWLAEFIDPDCNKMDENGHHVHSKNCVKLTWENIKKYADAHPDEVEQFDDTPPPPTREQEIRNEISHIEWEYKTTRTLSDAALGNEYALNRLREAETLLAPLRAELAIIL